MDSSSSMFVTVTPPSVLAHEKKIAIEKKKKEERAHYCAGILSHFFSDLRVRFLECVIKPLLRVMMQHHELMPLPY